MIGRHDTGKRKTNQNTFLPQLLQQRQKSLRRYTQLSTKMKRELKAQYKSQDA